MAINENHKKELTENQQMICKAIATILFVLGKVVLAVVIVLGGAIIGAAMIAMSLGGAKNS